MKNLNQLTYQGQIRRLRTLAKAAMGRYSIRVARIQFINHGENTTFFVTDKNGKKYLLRICRSDYHTAEALGEEIRWLQRLEKSRLSVEVNLQVPKPVVSLRRRTLETIATPGVPEGRQFVLFDWIDGRFVNKLITEAKFRLLGRVIGMLHLQTKSYAVKHRRYWNADGLVGLHAKFGSIDSLSVATKAQQATITHARKKLLKKLRRHESKFPERMGLIHADLHFGNFLFSSRGIGIIDFDDCGFGFLAYDLAIPLIALNRQAGLKLGERRRLKLALIAGYSELANWDEADEEALKLLMDARRLLMLGWLNSRSDNRRLRQVLKKAIPRTIKTIGANSV